MRKNNRMYAAVIGLAVAGVTTLATGSADGHGYVDSPVSRAKLCQQGSVTNCGPIQWEPQSVEGPKGFPAGGPSDGRICAGGLGQFSQLDDPRGGAWPTTQVSAGQSYSFRWRITARHSTTDFKYYITKNGWDGKRALTRADLDPQPFLSIPYGGQRPDATVTHQAAIPSGKTGRHLILGVWTINDTGNAFYSCADVRV
ncbi:lytic polysaccharide monooxygenase [Streptomyces sp. NPDC050504]|uniref:lytic polysaccharide monooxygenase auxiliary activity family 9 protein n=1 Tax=Streptomyces sp. NPDC050504 TaxID=3365618 RepID=UPI00379C538C